jgi:hypothetical protein
MGRRWYHGPAANDPMAVARRSGTETRRSVQVEANRLAGGCDSREDGAPAGFSRREADAVKALGLFYMAFTIGTCRLTPPTQLQNYRAQKPSPSNTTPAITVTTAATP